MGLSASGGGSGAAPIRLIRCADAIGLAGTLIGGLWLSDQTGPEASRTLD